MSSCGCKGVRTCLVCKQQNSAVTSKSRSAKVHGKDLDNQDAWMASWKVGHWDLSLVTFSLFNMNLFVLLHLMNDTI